MSVEPSSTTAGVPDFKPYEIDEAEVDEMFAAAGRGDWLKVAQLITGRELGWLGYEMERLAKAGEYYGVLESGADSLTGILQAHTKKGKVELSDSMRKFLEQAVTSMKAAGTPPSSDIQAIIDKVLSGKEIDEGEAKKLYAWCLSAKAVVVPGEYRAETISAQVKSLRERYDQAVLAGKDLTQIFMP